MYSYPFSSMKVKLEHLGNDNTSRIVLFYPIK